MLDPSALHLHPTLLLLHCYLISPQKIFPQTYQLLTFMDLSLVAKVYGLVLAFAKLMIP